ncbi:hypothetical protein CCUS01_08884 [Colletotrichum cuscutae]|uniref:Glycolipid transfer protein domain-containing protein n=1 Tax=Colletotrichum cuscutae TaxID=1209917 RepID=A0AAI9UL70_9PEZI|nr:hypothetical protein CCUS01_08884 [Colletotrichum cuscutae]
MAAQIPPGGTYLDTFKKSFVDVKPDADKENAIPTSDFLDASESLTTIFDALGGVAFGPVKSDMGGNIKKIRERQLAAPGESATLQELVKAELATKKHVATEGLLWLVRGLEFTCIALSQNVAKESEELSESFRNAYATTLKPHHSFLVKPIFSAAMSACPYRKDFYAKLGSDQDKVAAELRVYLASLEKVVGILKGFLASKDAKCDNTQTPFITPSDFLQQKQALILQTYCDMSSPDQVTEQSKFQIQLPAELYLEIAQWLGQFQAETKRREYVIETYVSPADDDVENDIIRDLRDVEFSRTIISAAKEMHPTRAMLNAGMVNKYYHKAINDIALRWDAQSEDPRAVYHAAVHNNVDLLRQALEKPGAKPDYVPHSLKPSIWTPLMVAASKGYAQVVDLLLHKGANPALSFAARHRSWWEPRPFAASPESGIGLYEFDRDLYGQPSPLHAAMLAPENALTVSKTILRSLPPRFLTKISDPHGLFLAIAVARDHVDLVDMLINRGADFDHGGITSFHMNTPVLHHAVSGDMVRKLTLAGAPLHTPVEFGLNALHAVCLRQTDCSSAIRELVRQGVKLEETTTSIDLRPPPIPQQGPLRKIPQTALNLACRQLNVAHIRTLLELGAHPLGACLEESPRKKMKGSKSVKDSELYKVTPLHDLFLPDYFLLEAHYKSNEETACAIKAAFNLIISHPLAVEAVSSYGNFTLGFPSSDLMHRISRSFWKSDYSDYTGDFGRYTPLQIFFVHPFSDDPEIPQAMFDLVEDGKDQINAIIKPLYITPLLALLGHRFDHSLGDANFYRPKLLKWLLEHGADPNLCDKEGFSPLHYAVFWLDAPAVKLLLLHGAQVKREDELQVMDVLFGGVFTRAHQEQAKSHCHSRETDWARMVEQVGTEWSTHGIGSNIERWQPGTPLPACTLFNFEGKFMFELDEEAPVPSELVTRWGGLREALRGDADERRKRIFAALLRTPNVLPFLKPRGVMERDGEVNLGEDGSGPDTIRYSVLDWARATAQKGWFLRRIKRLGGETGSIRPKAGLEIYGRCP